MNPPIELGRPDRPVIFLDIDGVLNDHKIPEGVLCGQIDRSKVDLLNEVLRQAGADIVLSSAWRYIIHRGEMNLAGLNWLFQSHGLLARRIVGVTGPDTEPMNWDGNPHSWRGAPERGAQIAAYLEEHPATRYVVVDDLDLGISNYGHPFVQTDGVTGLTRQHVIAILNHLLPQKPCVDCGGAGAEYQSCPFMYDPDGDEAPPTWLCEPCARKRAGEL